MVPEDTDSMKKRKRTIRRRSLGAFMAAMLVCLFLHMSCERIQAAEESGWPEWTDAACRITGYTGYRGKNGSCFLQEGDRVAVVSLSSPADEGQIRAAAEGLGQWGYIPVEGKYLHAEVCTLDNLLEDLKWALTDPDIKAVFCIRGGYGASEVIDRLPEGMAASSGKLILGYSDVTVCLAAWSAAGLPSIHASMAAAFTELPPECVQAEQYMLQGRLPVYKCAGSAYNRTGTAEGVLIGGNLSTFTAVLETAYDCTKMEQPYILFLEDVGEDMRHLHRSLTILKHHGVLDRAAGLLFGEWYDLRPDGGAYDGRTRGGLYASVEDMISREFLSDLDVPAAFGFPAGHGPVNYPLLMGEPARLAVSEDGYILSW